MITVQTAKSLTTISVAKVLPGQQPISLGPRPGFRYAATLKDYSKWITSSTNTEPEITVHGCPDKMSDQIQKCSEIWSLFHCK